MSENDLALLDLLANRLADDPEFIAWALARYCQHEGLTTRDALAIHLRTQTTLGVVYETSPVSQPWMRQFSRTFYAKLNFFKGSHPKGLSLRLRCLLRLAIVWKQRHPHASALTNPEMPMIAMIDRAS